MKMLKITYLWLLGTAVVFGLGHSAHHETGDATSMPAGENVTRASISGKTADLNENNGAALYQRRCGACHSIDANRIGPRHRGVFGRVAGSLPDYNYSNALQNADFVWDDRALDLWLANPENLVPGQKMGFRLNDANERVQIIDYLKSQKD